MENRAFKRIPIKIAFINASSPNKTYKGIVKNVSRFGFAIAYLSSPLMQDEKTLKVLMTIGELCFEMNVETCWTTTSKNSVIVGVQINHPPQEWLGFISRIEYCN